MHLRGFFAGAFAWGNLAAEPPLIESVGRDDLASAVSQVATGGDVTAANAFGATPLYLACRNGNAAMISLLLDAGADPAAASAGGETALMTAARTGRPDCVALLLSRGAPVDARERKGQTALMWAAAAGHVEVVDLLLAAGADFNLALDSGFDALFFAVRQGQLPVVQSLLRAGAKVDQAATADGKSLPAGTSPLLLAIENGHFELALALVDAGADPNDMRTGFAPLHAVTWVRKPPSGDGADGIPPPAGSGSLSSLEWVREMAARGADVNARVTHKGGGGGKIEIRGSTPFLLAAQNEDLPLMELLVELGADPALTNDTKTTPLMVAAGVGVPAPGEEPGTPEEAIATVNWLLDRGANIDAVDANGETAMHGAAYKALTEMVGLLDKRGAKIEVWNRKNRRGWTPLLISQGFRDGNFRPIAEMEEAISEVMRRNGVEPPPAPARTD